MADENNSDNETVVVNVAVPRGELEECRLLARIEMSGPAIRSMMRLGMQCERSRIKFDERMNGYAGTNKDDQH